MSCLRGSLQYITSSHPRKNLLLWLKHHETWLVVNTDKNLGPCVIEICTYIRDALIHLQDTSTYASTTKKEAAKMCGDLYKQIFAWTVEGRKEKKLFLMTKSNIPENTVNATVKIIMGIFVYSTKFTKLEKLEHQCLLDLYVLTVTASPTPLASG